MKRLKYRALLVAIRIYEPTQLLLLISIKTDISTDFD